VKKFLLIFIILSTVNCAQTSDKNKKNNNFLCPSVYFSSQNNSYVKIDNNLSESDLENIIFKAKFNNFAFNKKCTNKDMIKKIPIDILITIEDFNLNKSDIELPVFAFLYDKNEIIIDKQFFLITKKPKFNAEDYSYSMDEIVERLEIITKDGSEISTIVIGFMKINDSY